MICPCCHSRDIKEFDDGPDDYDGYGFTSHICSNCKLYHDGWGGAWYKQGTNWRDVESGEIVPYMTKQSYEEFLNSNND